MHNKKRCRKFGPSVHANVSFTKLFNGFRAVIAQSV
jgi:hypothetical protein